MGQATDAVVTIVSGKFFGEDGDGTAYLRSGEPADLVDKAIDITTMMGDEVARVMEAIHLSPALRAELDRIESLPEGWGEEHLIVLKASLVAAGIL